MQLRVDDYILSKRFGLGRISYLTDNSVGVYFADGSSREFVYDLKGLFYAFIPNSELLIIKEMLTKIPFSSSVKSRAADYASLTKFYSFKYDESQHTISAKVLGTDDYLVRLDLLNKKVSCTCPYYDNCKHEYALLLLLNRQMDFDNAGLEADMSESDFSKEVAENLDTSISIAADDYIANYLDIGSALALYNVLKKTTDDPTRNKFISVYFNQKYENNLVLQGLYDIFALANPNIFKKLVNPFIFDNDNKKIINDETITITNSAYFSRKDENISAQYFTYECIILKRFRKLFDALTNNKFLLQSDFYFKYLGVLIDYIKRIGLDIIPLFSALCNLTNNTVYDGHIAKIYNELPSNLKERAFVELPSRLYKILSPDDLIERMSYSYNNTDFFRILVGQAKEMSVEERFKYFKKILAQSPIDNYSSNSIYHLKRYVDLLPHCEILYSYLTNAPESYWKRFERLSYASLVYDKDIKQVNDQNVELYFRFDAQLNYYEDFDGLTYSEIYTLYDLGDNVVLCAEIKRNEDRVEIHKNCIDEKGQTKYIKYLIAYCNLKDEKFIEEKSKANDKLNDLNHAKHDQELIDAFDDISNTTVDEVCKQLSPENLVGIEYHLTIPEDNLGHYLQLKVGINKMYAVSSIRNFVSNFKEGYTQNYGKNLSFKHTLDNLKEEDRPIMRFFISLFDVIETGKYIHLKSAQMNVFLNLLKGREVYINEDLYTCRLNKKPYQITLNEKYQLNILDLDKSCIFSNGAILYYIDKSNHVLDILETNKSKIKLIKLIASEDNLSIERVKKEFIQKVFPIFEKDIIVDESIKEEFISSILTIKAYFDMTKDEEISLASKYIKYDKEIALNEINVASDIGKVNKYQNMIQTLGFDDENLIKDQNMVMNFLAFDFSGLKEVCEVYLSDSLAKKKIMAFTPPTLKMKFDTNMMEVFMLGSEYDDAELYKIFQAIKNKKRFVLLKNDHIIDLQDEEVKKFAETVEDLGLDKKHLSKVDRKPIYQTLAAFSHQNNIEMDDYLKNMVAEIKNFKSADKQLPNLNAELRSYQKEGFNWLKILSEYQLGGILADDMGLGKTLQTIALIASDEKQSPSLIVAPKSLVFNWLAEFEKFAPNIETKIIYGNAEQRSKTLEEIDPNKKVIYLTSYDSLRNDIDNYKAEFTYLILDEAQYIKNVNALKTITIKQVKAIHRFALTGTPIENDVFDLWSIFDFLMPAYLPSLSQFKQHANEDDFKQLVKRRVAPFILRRTKQDVLKDLPEKFERVIAADMTTSQRKLYDAVCLEAKDILESGGKPFEVLHLLTRLRQICVDPKTYIENYKGKSGKTEMLKELITSYVNEGHRILIFSQFVSALNIVEEFLQNQNIRYFIITGKTKGKERLELVNEFNENTDIKIFLISLKAGGNGLNLVGADTVIHFDPWWNLAAENQATDRAYRIGQTKNVEVIRLISENSIEQRVIQLQYMKKDLIDQLISNDTSSIEKMSIDDLKFILEDN